MIVQQNALIYSMEQVDLYNPIQPVSPESSIENDTIITTRIYDIPLATIRQEEEKIKFHEKMKKCCDCIIL